MGRCLICHYFNIEYSKTLDLPLSKFNLLIDQAINIGCLNSGKGFELKTSKDKDEDLRAQIKELRAKGILSDGK